MIKGKGGKRKGIVGERELIDMFWSYEGWCAHRVAGSGSSKHPSPDIIAGNGDRKLSIEAKMIKKGAKYFPPEEIEALKEFSFKFGAEPWIAIKFYKENWLFLNIEDLRHTGRCYCADENDARNKGLLMQELIK